MFDFRVTLSIINDLLNQKKISANKMLIDCGLGTSTIKNMESGSVPSVDKILAIADYLGCSVDYLLGRDMIQKNIVILVSGGGTNLQALINAQKRGEINNGRITCVISSKQDAYALERAKQNNIKTRIIPRKDYDGVAAYSEAVLAALKEENADLIVYAGFMTILDECVCREYENKMINVHPALIPSFCGKGYYGLRVHEAVLERGVKLTGATVHFVNEICDGGPIILQKAIPVLSTDTPETLQKRVMEQCEWELLPKAVSLVLNS